MNNLSDSSQKDVICLSYTVHNTSHNYGLDQSGYSKFEFGNQLCLAPRAFRVRSFTNDGVVSLRREVRQRDINDAVTTRAEVRVKEESDEKTSKRHEADLLALLSNGRTGIDHSCPIARPSGGGDRVWKVRQPPRSPHSPTAHILLEPRGRAYT